MLFLYLDIDGVAIPDRQADQSITFAMSNRLRRILDRTGAKLVISSHRRISKLTVLNLLSAAGFTRHDFAETGALRFCCRRLQTRPCAARKSTSIWSIIVPQASSYSTMVPSCLPRPKTSFRPTRARVSDRKSTRLNY